MPTKDQAQTKEKTAHLWNDKGFSLIELMITVAIIGILGGISMFIYTPIRERTNCERVVTDVYNAMSLLVEDVAEDGVAPAAAGFANTQNIGGAAITFSPNVQISFAGAGTAANPFTVNGRRSDFVCPQGDGVYTLLENQTDGLW